MKNFVSELLRSHVMVVPPEMSVREAGWFMMQRSIGAVPVVDSDAQVKGLLSRTDVLRHGYSGGQGDAEIHSRHHRTFAGPYEVTLERAEPHSARPDDVPVADVMTPVAIRVSPDTPCSEAARLMRTERIHHVLVMSEGRLLGILSAVDLLELLEPSS